MSSCVLCIDNSEWTRNGDYFPSRLEAQLDAASCISNMQIESSMESVVGMLSMAGPKGVEVLVSSATDVAVILSAFSRVNMGGVLHLSNGLRTAHLVLKNQKSKKQMIVAFVCSPVVESDASLQALGKLLKKSNIGLTVICMGETDENQHKLLELVNATNTNNNSQLMVVPPGAGLVDCIMSSPLLVGAEYHQAGPVTGQYYSDTDFDIGLDTELAMAILASTEEARAQAEIMQLQQQQQQGVAVVYQDREQESPEFISESIAESSLMDTIPLPALPLELLQDKHVDDDSALNLSAIRMQFPRDPFRANALIQGRYRVLRSQPQYDAASYCLYDTRDENSQSRPMVPSHTCLKVFKDKQMFMNEVEWHKTSIFSEVFILEMLSSFSCTVSLGDEGDDSVPRDSSDSDAYSFGIIVYPKLTSTLSLYIHQSLGSSGNESTCIFLDLQKICYDIISALDYLHNSHQLVHSDLRPVNIVRSQYNNNWLLTNLEYSSKISEPMRERSHCSAYCPPEAVWIDDGTGATGVRCKGNMRKDNHLIMLPAFDIWSLGCVLYELFSNGFPLFLKDREDNISADKEDYDSSWYLVDWKEESCKRKLKKIRNEQVKDLLSHILVKNPDERPLLTRIKNDSFLEEYRSSKVADDSLKSTSSVEMKSTSLTNSTLLDNFNLNSLDNSSIEEAVIASEDEEAIGRLRNRIAKYIEEKKEIGNLKKRLERITKVLLKGKQHSHEI